MTSVEIQHVADVSIQTPAIVSWVTTSDHKKVGRLFIGVGLFALLVGLVVAILITFERIDAQGYQLLTADTITQMLATARLLLTFGAVIPLLLGLAIAVVPLQLGARSIAFGRLAAGGFWMWLTGLGLAVSSIMDNGGPGGGESEMVDLYLAATIVMALGIIMAALSIATTVFTSRAPGMGLLRAPLFSWSSLLGSLTLLMTMPVFIGTTIYLYVDHRYARAGFGGNVGVKTWVGWAQSQPFTFLLALPALGIVLDIIPVMGRTQLLQRSGAYVALGLASITVLAATTQSKITLPWNGNKFLDNAGAKIADLLPFVLLNVLPVMGLLGVLAISLLTLRKGKPKVAAPLVFALLGLINILDGVAAHILAGIEDAGLQGTIYEAGEYVAITFGTLIIAFGGICYWGPKLWGRKISDKAAIALALLAFVATAIGSLAYMVAGFADQPSGVVDGFSYSGPQELWNALTCGSFVLMFLVALGFIALAFKSFTSGAIAGDDPWDGSTLEWATSSPPPTNNFSEVVVVGSGTPLTDMKNLNSTGKES